MEEERTPFDPPPPRTRTAEQWAEAIRGLINQAEEDGYIVDIGNDCCGCSKMHLFIGPDDVDLWESEGRGQQVQILDLRRD